MLIITSTLVACYCVALALDWPDWVNGVNWEWVRRSPALLGQRWGWLAAFAAAVGATWWLVAHGGVWNGRRRAFLVGWVALLTPLAQLLFAGLHAAQPVMVPISMESGFYHEGVRIEAPLAFVQNHLEQMPHYRDVHLWTQPPGWTLTYWAAARLWAHFPGGAEWAGRWLLRYDCLDFELQELAPAQLAAGSLPLLLVLLTGLGVLPFYGLAYRFLGARLARRALLFYPLWPGLLVFTGRFDTVYAVLALVALWLAQVVLTGEWRGRPLSTKGVVAMALTFGGLLAGGTWFGFGVLGIVLLVNCILLAQVVMGVVAWRHGLARLVWLNGAFLGGLLLFWGGVWLLWGANGLEMFLLSQQLHARLRLVYPVWPLFNGYDLAVFMGIVLLVGSFVGVALALRRWGRWQAGDALAVGWLTAVLLLNLSGQVRAETGRLWLLLMGPGLLAGLWGWHRLFNGKGRGWETAVYALFGVQAVVTALFLGGRMAPPSVPSPVWHMPETAVPLAYHLGDKLALPGYELRQDADLLTVNLYWQALDFPGADYSVLAHLVTADGAILVQDDGPPRDGQLPTWCWVPGEVVADERVFLLSAATEDPASILVGLYDWRTGARLPIAPPTADNAIPIEIPQE